MLNSIPLPEDETMMLVDAYLAGELRGEALASFEWRLRTDEVLAAEVAAQRRLGQALRGAFAEPGAQVFTVPDPVPDTSGVVAGRIGPSRRWYGVAAAAIMVIGAGVAAYAMLGRGDKRLIPGEQTAAEVYAAVLKGGFKPPVVCPNEPALFAELVKNRLGVDLFPDFARGVGVALTGWGYSNHWGTPLGPGTLVLLAERGEAKIIVIMDRLKSDRMVAPPKAGARMFRKVAGDLVLYEITPLDEPIVLPMLDAR
jgi:hypothetical protein